MDECLFKYVGEFGPARQVRFKAYLATAVANKATNFAYRALDKPESNLQMRTSSFSGIKADGTERNQEPKGEGRAPDEQEALQIEEGIQNDQIKQVGIQMKKLKGRKQEIPKLRLDGMKNQEIVSELGIKAKTVANEYEKIKERIRTESEAKSEKTGM